MIDRIPDVGLFLRFVELDGSTEGKNPEPIRWFKQRSPSAAPSGATARRAARPHRGAAPA